MQCQERKQLGRPAAASNNPRRRGRKDPSAGFFARPAGDTASIVLRRCASRERSFSNTPRASARDGSVRSLWSTFGTGASASLQPSRAVSQAPGRDGRAVANAHTRAPSTNDRERHGRARASPPRARQVGAFTEKFRVNEQRTPPRTARDRAVSCARFPSAAHTGRAVELAAATRARLLTRRARGAHTLCNRFQSANAACLICIEPSGGGYSREPHRFAPPAVAWRE